MSTGWMATATGPPARICHREENNMNAKKQFQPLVLLVVLLMMVSPACSNTAQPTPIPPSSTPTIQPSATFTPTPTLTYTPSPTFTPTLTPSPTPIALRKGHVVVGVGQPAHITFGWVAATEELTQDFLDGLKVTMTINGKPVPEAEIKNYWGPITEYHSDDMNGFAAYWTYTLENNPIFQTPGIYRIEVKRVFTKNVTDGFIDPDTQQPVWFLAGVRLSTISVEVEITP